MSGLSGEVPLDFDFPIISYEGMVDSYETYDPSYYEPMFEPMKYESVKYNNVYEATTPPAFTFDPSLLELPCNPGHGRSSSYSSTYSTMSSTDSSPASVRSTPSPPTPPPVHYSPPVRQHGPILLPKIRPQDQAIDAPAPVPATKRAKRTATSSASTPRRTPIVKASAKAKTHARSLTNPETLSYAVSLAFSSQSDDVSLVASPASVSQDSFSSNYHTHARRSSSIDNSMMPSTSSSGFVFPQMQAYVPATPRPSEAFMFPSCYTKGPAAPVSRPSPVLSMAATPEPAPPAVPQTNLATYLTSSNPAPSLVQNISYHRDLNTKNFWWDVRQIRSWNNFNAATILSLPGAANLLSCPIPAPALPAPAPGNRLPETETSLHKIYAAHYLPKLNAALALCSARPLQLSVPTRTPPGTPENIFVATVAGEPASAATIFGGKPSARVVGLVRSYDRFNTGMRADDNIKRVKYLDTLAALHYAMREHGCRYGFILTEIELVIVRNGIEPIPHFGSLEVTSVQLNASVPEGQFPSASIPDLEGMPLTACLALWGLCMMAGDEPAPGQAHWRSEIGAPAEATRRKTTVRDSWMPQPQLSEKRAAKRSRGWVMPDDAVGRKELGKRGVKYGGC
jgi:hypothetical protein